MGYDRVMNAKHRLKSFSKAALSEVAEKGQEWDFNARLPSDLVIQLPEGEYPTVVAMSHRHKHGQPCEEHCRCGVMLEGRLVTFDVPLWYFNSLPEGDFEIDV